MAPPFVTLTWPDKPTSFAPDPGVLRRIEDGKHGIRLLEGDNAHGLAGLIAENASPIAFAYLDPPFLTGKQHARVRRSRDPVTGTLSRSFSLAFDDRWQNLGVYLNALGQRIALCRELLIPEGSLVVHVDPKTSHYVKVLCDEIFGPDCFASEIVWRYRRWPAKTRNFQRVHDVLLRYVKDPNARCRFNPLYEPLAPSTLATWGTGRQRAVVGKDGRRERSSTTREPTLGAPMGDVWEIGIVAPVSRERTGYPTQKPEPLLSRLIQACSDPGDTVLDPYAGSGTTLAVAARLGRRAIGIDQSEEAVAVCRARMVAAGVSLTVDRVLPPGSELPRLRKTKAATAAAKADRSLSKAS